MASENAKAVAQEVIKSLGTSRKVSLRKIIKGKGYSQETADTPKNVTQTKSYQETVAPFVQKLIVERDAAIDRMKKVRSKAKYRDLTDAIDKLTKNLQLLTGGSTENLTLQPLAESIKKIAEK